MKQEHMDPAQFLALTTMVAASEERQHQKISELKEHLGLRITETYQHIGSEIRDMNTTLKDHNGRLREEEEQMIRMSERTKVMSEMVAEQREICSKHLLNIKNLTVVERWLNWIISNPVKSIGLIITSLGALLAISNFIFHIFEK